MKEGEKIRVCHMTSVHSHEDVRIYHKECSSLAEAGFDTHLVNARGFEGEMNGVHFSTVEVNASGRLKRIFLTSYKVYMKALSLNASIYHFHDPELLPYGLLLKWKGKHVVYDAHEDVPKQIMGKYYINKYLRRIVSTTYRIFENFVAKRLSGVVVATPYIGERFSKIAKNFEVINNFPLSGELGNVKVTTSAEERKKYVCYVGGLTQIRGIDELVDAMNLVEGTKLLMAGPSSPASYVDTLKNREGWKNVEYLGNVSREKVAEILNQSLAGIVTFHGVPNHVDAQPNKMFEYMSAGLPVIASNFPVWKNVIEGNECGICVDPVNPQEIADAILKLRSDSDLVNELSENGKKAIEVKYNWDAQAKLLLAFYSKILS